jgi:hypothetical protein
VSSGVLIASDWGMTTNNGPSSGQERQKQIQREQHRPEQDEGYDEAARGNLPVKLDITQTTATEQGATRSERVDDHAAREAANDVRRRDHSAE